MSDLDPLRNLAQTLAYDPGQPVTMTKGTVQAYAIGGQPPTLDLYLSGDNTTLIQGVRFLDSYSPALGDVVQVLKQGPMLLVVGQIAGGAAAGHAANGWVTPLLSSGCSEHPSDPPYYRLILDNGSKKVQLRGQILLTGSPTTLWQMPEDLRPAFDMGHLSAARDSAGGSTVIQIWPRGNSSAQSGADVGKLMLQGHNVAPAAAQHGNLTTSYYNVNHFHEQNVAGNFTGEVRYSTGGAPIFGVLGGSAQDGGRDPNHRHTTNSATHAHVVAPPGWVSLNGIEYFI